MAAGEWLHEEDVTDVIAFIALALLSQDAPCPGEVAARLADASGRAAAFDLAGAAEGYAAAGRGCQADVAAHYLRGLMAARAAYAQGGSAESLAPVRQAIAALEERADAGSGSAEIARFVLLAASAAAQSERDEMALMIDQAMRLEALQLAAAQPGAPAVTAHEVAGDLWLQVHRYEDARRAYLIASERVGFTARVRLGLARAASRLGDLPGACLEYGVLLDRRKAEPDEPPEFREARAFVQQSCARAR